MTPAKITIAFLYITVFLMLASPSMNLPQNMIEFGPVHIYLFEFPLILTYALSFAILLSRMRFVGRKAFHIYGLFILIALIGFIGAAMYATVAFQTVLKDLRYIFYWLAGVIVVFVGHKQLRLKTLSWVIAAGLLTQISIGIILVKIDPSILSLHGFRLPGRSGWLSIFFVSLLFMMITYKKRLSAIGKYKIVPIMVILVPLLTHVLLGQNRTTWIALFLMTLYWVVFYARFAAKIKFSIGAGIVVLVIAVAFQVMPYHESFKYYLGQRLFQSTLSEQGIRGTWEGKREAIYKSNLRDFQKHPIFGNGFGHQLYFDFTSYGIVKEDKEQSGTDNSFMNVLLKTGLAGFILFCLILYKMFSVMKNRLAVMEFSEEWIYLKAMVFAFPFFVLISLNISILYGYPEVMIFSLFFAKAALIRADIGSHGRWKTFVPIFSGNGA